MQAPSTLEASRDLSQRVIRLIETLRGPDDIVPEEIERTTGIAVQRHPERPATYGFGRVLDDRWIGNLVSLPDHHDGGAPKRLVFSFDDQTGGDTDLSAVCGLDFEAYARALVAAGYAPRANLGPRDAFRSFGFSRDGIDVEVEVRGENAANPTHLCVSSVIIDTAGVRDA